MFQTNLSRQQSAYSESRPASPLWRAKSPSRRPQLSGELVLIRGLPGSGKSTMAREMVSAGFEHFEADMFFSADGVYSYDASRIREAHAWCQQATRKALSQRKRVVVSNTFTRLQEMEPYRTMTRNVRIVEAQGKWENVHGVSAEMLQRMAQRWEPLPV